MERSLRESSMDRVGQRPCLGVVLLVLLVLKDQLEVLGQPCCEEAELIPTGVFIKTRGSKSRRDQGRVRRSITRGKGLIT